MAVTGELIVDPSGGRQPDACVILMHGLGADGHDFESLVPALGLPDSLAVRFVLPHAPQLAVTVNGGMTMSAWYDILDMSLGRRVDVKQLRASAQRIQTLIDDQVASGIESQRIVIAGFSQGGAVAYEAALSYPRPLAGLLALSTYFATADSIEFAEANRQLPIEVHHGSSDPVVPAALGREGAERLKAEGYGVNYRTYSMGHSLCPEQASDIAAWITTRLG